MRMGMAGGRAHDVERHHPELLRVPNALRAVHTGAFRAPKKLGRRSISRQA
jgi:hypothetical protein